MAFITNFTAIAGWGKDSAHNFDKRLWDFLQKDVERHSGIHVSVLLPIHTILLSTTLDETQTTATHQLVCDYAQS